MPKVRLTGRLLKSRRITSEVLRENPLLRMIARTRAKEIQEMRAENKKWRLDLDLD